MKHVKPLNLKARALEAQARGEQADVFALQMELPMSCSTVFDPGWEVDGTYGLGGLCQPMENDLYGCSADCWWPAQVPDELVNYSGWSDQCAAAVRDWQKIKFIDGAGR